MHSLLTWLLPLLTLILLWGMPLTASSQTCEHDARITELRAEISTPPADAYERLVYALALALEENCAWKATATAALGERNDARTDRDRQASRGDLLEQQNTELQRKLDAVPTPRWEPPAWVIVPLRIVELGGAACTAFAVGAGLPGEVTVGCAVGAAGAVIVDMVIEIVRR